MIAVIGGILKNTLIAEGDAVAEDYRVPEDGKLRVALVIDNRGGDALVTAAQGWLPFAGFTGVGTWRVSPTTSDISAQLTAVKAAKPHIILCAFAGPVSVVYSRQKIELGIPAMTIGVNVKGQQVSHWVNTNGKCEGEIMLDTCAVGTNNTVYTYDWFNAYMTRTDRYPVWTAGTYDAVKQVCRAIEATNSLDSDTLVAWLEDSANAIR